MNRFFPYFAALALGCLTVEAAATGIGVIERRPVMRQSDTATAPGQAASGLDLSTVFHTTIDYRQLSRMRAAIIERSSETEIAQFFEALRKGQYPPALKKGQWHAFANDVMGALLREKPNGVDIAPDLFRLVREAPDTVICDYALQHIAMLAVPRPGQAKDDQRTDALAILREAAGWKTSPLAGTALINLYHLGDGLADGSLAELALQVASDPVAYEASRSTALQIGVLLKDPRFLPHAVEIAQRSSIVAHRASAAHAITVLGGPEQRTLLLQLRRRGPAPITEIANHALAQFENEN